MVSVSMIATLLASGLVAQVPDRSGDWVVIASKEGPFSFAMPARPVEQSGDAQVANGMMRWKIYTCNKGEGVLVFRQQIYPPGARQNAASRMQDIPEEGRGVVITKVPIHLQGVSGMEVITKEKSPTGEGKGLSRLRVLEQGPNIYTMSALSGQGKPLSPEAAGFFNSIRFDGKPAVKPAMAVAMPAVTPAAKAPASLPAKRKLLGKINRDDRTADAGPAHLPDGHGALVSTQLPAFCNLC